MTVSGVSSVGGAHATDGVQAFKKTRDEFTQLSQALQSGSLAESQKAFEALTQTVQGAGGSSKGGTKDADGDHDGDAKKKADLGAVGTALKAGDLAGAKKAFATLQQNAKAAARGRAAKGRRHRPGSPQVANTAPPSPNAGVAAPIAGLTTPTGGNTLNLLV